MPKVRLSENAEANKKIVKAIKSKMVLYDLTPEKIAKAMDRNRMTYFRRMKNPGDFTLDELRAISFKTHIPLEKLVKGEVE